MTDSYSNHNIVHTLTPVRRSYPAILAVPLVGSFRPVRTDMRVVLPAPGNEKYYNLSHNDIVQSVYEHRVQSLKLPGSLQATKSA